MKKKEFVKYQLFNSLQGLSAGVAFGFLSCSFLVKIKFNFDIYSLIGYIFIIISSLIGIMIQNNYGKKYQKLVESLSNDK
jgi:hypothetical protein